MEKVEQHNRDVIKYNNIKYLLEDEVVETQKQSLFDKGSTNVNKIIAWITSKIEAIIQFGRNLFSNKRFDSIKEYINKNMNVPQIQVPKFLGTINSQMEDLTRYLRDIENGNFTDRFSIQIPSMTEMMTVTKSQFLHIVNSLSQGQSLFNNITSTFNRIKTKMGQNPEQGSEITINNGGELSLHITGNKSDDLQGFMKLEDGGNLNVLG